MVEIAKKRSTPEYHAKRAAMKARTEAELQRLDERVAHTPQIAITDEALPNLADPDDTGGPAAEGLAHLDDHPPDDAGLEHPDGDLATDLRHPDAGEGLVAEDQWLAHERSWGRKPARL